MVFFGGKLAAMTASPGYANFFVKVKEKCRVFLARFFFNQNCNGIPQIRQRTHLFLFLTLLGAASYKIRKVLAIEGSLEGFLWKCLSFPLYTCLCGGWWTVQSKNSVTIRVSICLLPRLCSERSLEMLSKAPVTSSSNAEAIFVLFHAP